MSQEEVLNILNELGGEATLKEVRERAKEKYPNAKLYTYVWTRLNQLINNRKVIKIGKRYIVKK